MCSNTVSLNDTSVVHFVKRGTAQQITIYQEDIQDFENGAYFPAKSLTITNKDSIKSLRSFLNSLDLD